MLTAELKERLQKKRLQCGRGGGRKAAALQIWSKMFKVMEYRSGRCCHWQSDSNETRCGRKWTSTRTINSTLFSKRSLLRDAEIPTSIESRIALFMLVSVPSITWMTRLAWCWTSWRRLASVWCPWQVWDRHWCGVFTRRWSDGSQRYCTGRAGTCISL